MRLRLRSFIGCTAARTLAGLAGWLTGPPGGEEGAGAIRSCSSSIFGVRGRGANPVEQVRACGAGALGTLALALALCWRVGRDGCCKCLLAVAGPDARARGRRALRGARRFRSECQWQSEEQTTAIKIAHYYVMVCDVGRMASNKGRLALGRARSTGPPALLLSPDRDPNPSRSWLPASTSTLAQISLA